MKTAGIILAAGNSSRLGHNKQLIHINGESLIRRTVTLALRSGCSQVFVICGFENEKIIGEISDLSCEARYHSAWHEGIGGSLAFGMNAVMAQPETPHAVLVLLPDQFAVREQHILALIQQAKTSNKTIIASTYLKTYGPPVIFKSNHFHELAKLRGSQGAKKLIDHHNTTVETIECEAAAFDLDTPSDLALLATQQA